MDPEALRLIRGLRRELDELKRTAVVLRHGEMTSATDVSLGGADDSYPDVASVHPIGTAASGDRVAALQSAGDLLLLGRVGPGELHTSLPATASEGDVILYEAENLKTQLTDTAVIWILRFNGTRWDFLAGSPLRDEVNTQESVTSTTYANIATAGPFITVPEDGEFVIQHGALMSNGTPALFTAQSFGVGAGASGAGPFSASDTQAAVVENPNLTGAISGRVSAMRSRQHATALAAGDEIACKYRVEAASTGNANLRWIEVVPLFLTP